MKKILAIVCALVITLGVSAGQKKVIVTYFSATGTTAAVARQVADAAGADLYEITPAAKYNDADLNWRNRECRSIVEMMDKTSRPALKGKVKKMKKYDVVYVGFPIWCGVAPHIINTFIEQAKLEGKTIIPFATSGSSPIDGAVKELRATYPTLTITDGKLLNHPTAADIEAFVK